MRASSMINSVQQNTRDYELKLREVERKLSQASEEELRIEREIAKQLTAIAALQLDHNLAFEHDAERQLTLRREEEQSMRDQLAVVEKSIATSLADADTARKAIEVSEIRVRQILSSDAKYASAAEQYAAVLKAHQEAEQNEQEIADECKRKLAPFDGDDLYRYLTECGFGTEAYDRAAAIRYLDRWIARLSNFDSNRKNELTLLGMREEIAKASAQRQDKLTFLKGEVDALRNAAVMSAGQNTLIARLEELEAQIAREKKRANEIHARLAEYVEKRDSRYGRARDIVAEALKAQSAEDLLARAEKTPDIADDAMAKNVIRLRESLKQHRDRYSSLHTEKVQADRAYQKAKDLERRLKDRSYTSSDYTYGSGLDLDGLIVGYMLGRVSADSAVDEVRQHRREIEQPTWSSSSSGSSGSSGGFNWASSSDSIFSTSDSSGGGGFDTTDSF